MKSLPKSRKVDVVEIAAKQMPKNYWQGYTFDRLNERMAENRVEIAVEQAALRVQVKDEMIDRFTNPLQLVRKVASGIIVAKYSWKLFGLVKKARKLFK